jgi:hypothetical protein
MQIGISASTTGRLARPAALRAVAAAAEQLGYASIWVGPDPASAGTEGVDLDPIAVLGAVAAATTTVRIGADVVVKPRCAPADIAGALVALDVMSDGRLTVGLGLEDGRTGPDGAGQTVVGAVLDELEGAEPGPAVLLSAADLAGLEHLGARTGGWYARGARLDRIAREWGRANRLVWRPPSPPLLVVPAPVELTERPLSWSRAPYRGDLEQVTDDLDVIRRAGADEVILGMKDDVGLDRTLDVYARLAESLEQRLPLC